MIVTRPKKLRKISPNASRKITVWEHTCQKCGHSWTTKISNPNTCPDKMCRSPNWNKDYSVMK